MGMAGDPGRPAPRVAVAVVTPRATPRGQRRLPAPPAIPGGDFLAIAVGASGDGVLPDQTASASSDASSPRVVDAPGHEQDRALGKVDPACPYIRGKTTTSRVPGRSSKVATAIRVLIPRVTVPQSREPHASHHDPLPVERLVFEIARIGRHVLRDLLREGPSGCSER